jgi:hypothetical protein
VDAAITDGLIVNGLPDQEGRQKGRPEGLWAPWKATRSAGGGNIQYLAANDVTLVRLNAGGGNVRVEATAGSIT